MTTITMDNTARRPIRYSELIRFFAAVKRSTRCHACGQDTLGWTFHVDGHHVDLEPESAQDPYMACLLIPVSFPTRPDFTDQTAPALCIECPRCGNMEFVHASRVQQFLDGLAQGVRKNE